MKKQLVALCCVAAAVLAVPVPAAAHPDPGCDAADILCIRHCNTYHRGLDRIVCLVDHNFALPPSP